MSTNCHECGHSIDAHHHDEDAQIDACWEPIYAVFNFGMQECACPCRLKPSQIAARLDTAGEWVQRIDREKAKIIGWVAYRSGGDLDDVVDAVLDALPELMSGGFDE